MPLYFFEVGSRFGAVEDAGGTTFESIADALDEADQSARELLAQAIISHWEPPCDVRVYDEHHRKVAEVMLKDLVPNSLR